LYFVIPCPECVLSFTKICSQLWGPGDAAPRAPPAHRAPTYATFAGVEACTASAFGAQPARWRGPGCAICAAAVPPPVRRSAGEGAAAATSPPPAGVVGGSAYRVWPGSGSRAAAAFDLLSNERDSGVCSAKTFHLFHARFEIFGVQLYT
jgi:hypothetical protein